MVIKYQIKITPHILYAMGKLKGFGHVSTAKSGQGAGSKSSWLKALAITLVMMVFTGSVILMLGSSIDTDQYDTETVKLAAEQATEASGINPFSLISTLATVIALAAIIFMLIKPLVATRKIGKNGSGGAGPIGETVEYTIDDNGIVAVSDMGTQQHWTWSDIQGWGDWGLYYLYIYDKSGNIILVEKRKLATEQTKWLRNLLQARLSR